MSDEITELNDADEISRCIIYDRAFSEDVHVNNHLWQFDGAGSGPDGAYHQSAVLRRLAPTDGDVHKIGCDIAEKQNSVKQPPPGPERRYYCGFRTAIYGTLPKSEALFSIVLTHQPENGQVAHVDVALTVHVTGKNARANQRTNAGVALAKKFDFPKRHRCACDIGDVEHPFIKCGEDCLERELDDFLPLPWPMIE
jgi:hypothetical protein